MNLQKLLQRGALRPPGKDKMDSGVPSGFRRSATHMPVDFRSTRQIVCSGEGDARAGNGTYRKKVRGSRRMPSHL